MSEQNVRTVRGLYDAFNRGDFDTLKKGFSPAILWNEPENSLYESGNPYRSFPAVQQGVFTPLNRDFDRFQCEVEQLLDAGDYLVATGRYRGKCKDTGKTLGTQFCHVMHFDLEGRIDRVQQYADTLDEALVTGRVGAIQEMKIPQPVM